VYGVASSSHPAHTSLVKLDSSTETESRWSGAPHEFLGQPVFVSKSSAAASTHVDALDEDSGYILTVVFDGSDLSSNLAIFDAKDIARGPISRVKLPYALAFGQRGRFIPNLVFDFDEVQRRWKVSADFDE